MSAKQYFPELLEAMCEREQAGESVRSVVARVAARHPNVSPETLRTLWKRHASGEFVHRQRIFSDEEERHIAGVVVSNSGRFFFVFIGAA